MNSQFVMNVAMMCKQVPAYLPHELLGYPVYSLEGTLLSVELLSKINREENENSKEHNQKSSSRRDKFNSNR